MAKVKNYIDPKFDSQSPYRVVINKADKVLVCLAGSNYNEKHYDTIVVIDGPGSINIVKRSIKHEVKVSDPPPEQYKRVLTVRGIK